MMEKEKETKGGLGPGEVHWLPDGGRIYGWMWIGKRDKRGKRDRIFYLTYCVYPSSERKLWWVDWEW